MSGARDLGECSHFYNKVGNSGHSRGRGKKYQTGASSPSSSTQIQHNVKNEEHETKQYPKQDKLNMSDVHPGYKQHLEWLDELVYTWSQGNDLKVAGKLLRQYFSSSNNPHRTALFLMSQSPDYHSAKGNSLAITVVKTFQRWLGENNPSIKISTPVQKDAFQLLKPQNNTNLIQTVVEVYRMIDDPVLFVGEIKDLIREKRYKQACTFAKALGVQDHFDIFEILVPLVLQDKINFVQSYLENCPEQQEKFVQFIDSMCTFETNIYYLAKDLGIPQAKPEKCHPKAFKKLGSRLMKLYNIPSEKCPNISQINNTGALKYLLYKKYIEGNIGEENWDEMIEAAVQNTPQLQSELINSLVCYNDYPCALKYATKYNIPISALPESLQRCTEGQSHEQDTAAVEERWDDVDDAELFYQFPLSSTAIVFVDTKEKLMDVLEIIKTSGVIGIDGEWKPTFGLQIEKLAILQIATSSLVFIVDVLILLPILSEEDWILFVKTVFCNSSIIKLGFGIQSDLKMIGRTLPECGNLSSLAVKVLDLNNLMEKLLKLNPVEFPYGHGEARKGLTDLVKMCFGKGLDKSEQFSNWERRPLRDAQIVYAALDAYSLLEIFKFISEKTENLGIDLEAIINEITTAVPKKEKASKKNNPVKADKASIDDRQVASNFENAADCSAGSNEQQRSPAELAVVVDTMLQGLGRQLRLLGVDVKILENADSHEEALTIAMRENRVILTSGQPYKKLCQYVKSGMCYNVNLNLSAREQAAEVLTAFNIRITTSDIFSRCQKCNNNRYIKVPSMTVRTFWLDSKNLNDKDSDLYFYGTAFMEQFDGGTIDVENLVTDEGAQLQFDGITNQLFSRVDVFYICANCGKIYWEGSHLKRVVKALGNVVSSEDDITYPDG